MKKRIKVLVFTLVLVSLLFGMSEFYFKKKNTVKNNIIAIYIEESKDSYELSELTEIPKKGYILNTEKTVCENDVTPTWNKVTRSLEIKTNVATKCAIYLDKYVNENINIKKNTLNNNRLQIGTELSIDTEEFYIVSLTNDTAKILAKNNINTHTKKQDTDIITTHLYKDYNDYIDEYVDLLNKEYDISSKKASLTKAELSDLGCTIEENTCFSSTYNWLYNFNYYISIKNNNTLYIITHDGNIIEHTNENYSIRPILEINLEELGY